MASARAIPEAVDSEPNELAANRGPGGGPPRRGLAAPGGPGRGHRRPDLTGSRERHAHRMEDPEELAKGWWIGSGPVESAGKMVVGQRLKLAGRRWGEDGAKQVGHLRAFYRGEKGQWEAFGAAITAETDHLSHQRMWRSPTNLRGPPPQPSSPAASSPRATSPSWPKSAASKPKPDRALEAGLDAHPGDSEAMWRGETAQ